MQTFHRAQERAQPPAAAGTRHPGGSCAPAAPSATDRTPGPAPSTPLYRGRFAPSPTGPLHFGSLIAAVGSYLSARAAGGEWLVRIEDLDPPRTVPGAADDILRALEILGFEWHGEVLYQSTRSAAYAAAVERLLAQGDAFECTCSRAEILAAAEGPATPGEELRYPGWCRSGVRAAQRDRAIRFLTPPGEVVFDDLLQGHVAVDVSREVGDFVIRRRDGLFAYQLAVVVDDAEQGITHVVRGVDLLNSSPRQILLQRRLRLATPMYAHMPLAIGPDGVKLSKSAGAAKLDLRRPAEALWRALRFLRQNPPPALRYASPAGLWDWAVEHWTSVPLRGMRAAGLDGDNDSRIVRS